MKQFFAKPTYEQEKLRHTLLKKPGPTPGREYVGVVLEYSKSEKGGLKLKRGD